MAHAYRDLLVWQRGMDLTVAIYGLTHTFPRSELYGLCSQMQRASISIPSNIAEGWGRQSRKEFKNFLSIARGSVFELETQLECAQRLRYVTAEATATAKRLLEEISRMLIALMRSLDEPPSRS